MNFIIITAVYELSNQLGAGPSCVCNIAVDDEEYE